MMRNSFWRDFRIGFAVVFVLTILVGKLWGNLSMDNVLSLIGIIVSALAIVFINWNTSKQIRNQNDNINKQINNKNRESHRPYLLNDKVEKTTVTKLVDLVEKEKFDFAVMFGINELYKADEDEKEGKTDLIRCYIHSIFKIKNIGYGIAKYIWIESIDDKIEVSACNDKDSLVTSSNVKIEYVQEDEKPDIELKAYAKIKVEKTNSEEGWSYSDHLYLLLFYSDLNNNIYSMLIEFNFFINQEVKMCFYQCDTKLFDMKLKSLDVNYKILKRKYFEQVYGQEISDA